MDTPRIGAAAARAAADQLRAGRSDITILLGAHAATPGHYADDGAVRSQIEFALAGGDPATTAACARHLGTLATSEVDVALMADLGLDPAVALFLHACLGLVRFDAPDGRSLTLDRDAVGVAMRASLGQGWWRADADGHYVTTYRLPEAVSAMIDARNRVEPLPLREVVSHPVLDRYDILIDGTHTDDDGTLMRLGGEALERRWASGIVKQWIKGEKRDG